MFCINTTTTTNKKILKINMGCFENKQTVIKGIDG